VLLKKKRKNVWSEYFFGASTIIRKIISDHAMRWEKNSQFYDYMRNIFNSFYLKKKLYAVLRRSPKTSAP
jgi:hypothetical protein